MTVTIDSGRDLSSFDLYKRGLLISGNPRTTLRVRTNSSSRALTTTASTSYFTISRKILIAVLLIVTFLVVTLPATKAFGGFSLVPAERQNADLKGETITVVVEEGDTLWSIARRIDPEKDPRSIVDEFVAARGTANVYAGETIEWTL